MPVHTGWIRAARARPRPAHAPGVRKPCSTGPASRRCRGPRPGCRRGARPRAPWGVRSGRGTTGAVPAGGASGSPRAGPAGLAGRGRTVPAVETIRHRADGLWADMRTQVRGPGVHIPIHRIEPLVQLPVRQPLAVGAGLGEPGVPERVPRPVAGHARKPAVLQAQRGLPVHRAGHRPQPHRVHEAQHGAACGGNPRRQQGRSPKDRRTPADTAHTVVGVDLNTQAGTAPQPVGARRPRPGTEAGPQDRGARQGEPGAYFTNRQPVWPRPQDPPTVADTIWVWPAGSRPTPTTVGGDLDFGVSGAFLWGPFRGAGQGLPHGQGASPWGIPATREPDGVEVPSGRHDP